MIRKTKPVKKVNGLKTFGDADYRMGVVFGTRKAQKVGRGADDYHAKRGKMKR